MSYDAWLERPYQQMYADEPGACPACGEDTLQSQGRYEATCSLCGHVVEPDFESQAEAREEW